MRFILALQVAALAFALSAPRPVSAHFCSVPARIGVGEDVTVNIGVAAETTAVRAVDIAVPTGFTLIEPFGSGGYQPTLRGRWVHFEGGEIAPYSCHYFGFSGRASRRGRLVARIVTSSVEGTKTRYDDLRPVAQFPAQLIFAGVDPANYEQRQEKRQSGVSVWVALGAAVAAGVVVVGAAYLINRRR